MCQFMMLKAVYDLLLVFINFQISKCKKVFIRKSYAKPTSEEKEKDVLVDIEVKGELHYEMDQRKFKSIFKRNKSLHDLMLNNVTRKTYQNC